MKWSSLVKRSTTNPYEDPMFKEWFIAALSFIALVAFIFLIAFPVLGWVLALAGLAIPQIVKTGVLAILFIGAIIWAIRQI